MRSIVAFLGIGLSLSGLAMAGAPPKSTPELIAQGKNAFQANCMVCHGERGDGTGPASVALNPKPRDLTVSNLTKGKHYKNGGRPEEMFNTVSNGLTGTAMASFGHLPEQDRWAIVYYIQSSLRSGK